MLHTHKTAPLSRSKSGLTDEKCRVVWYEEVQATLTLPDRKRAQSIKKHVSESNLRQIRHSHRLSMGGLYDSLSLGSKRNTPR